MTRIPGSAQTRPRRKQGKAQRPLSLYKRIIREPYVKGLSRHILAAEAAPVFRGSLDNGSALCLSGSLLHLFNGLLAKEDQQLPFSRHVFAVCNDVITNRRLEFMQFMRPQKVVVSHP